MPHREMHENRERDRGLFSGLLARFGDKHHYLLVGLTLLVVALMLPGWRLDDVLPSPLSTTQQEELARQSRQTLALGLSSDNAPQTASNLQWQTIFLRNGETLAGVFRRENLSQHDLHTMLRLPQVAGMAKKIRPGNALYIGRDSKGQLQSLRYEEDLLTHLLVQREHKQFSAHIQKKTVQSRIRFASGQINSSLFAAGEQAGIGDALIMEMANIFGYDIDFALDIRQGDRFALVFEEQLVEGIPLNGGIVLAAEFVNGGNHFQAVRYTNIEGDSNYYTPDGKAMRKAFLRAPLQFTRISSTFNTARKHPILNKIRAHNGVDYAAPSGTPIYAAGDGKVSFAGLRGGYGRLVALQHGNQYGTHYAHLSRFGPGIRVGVRVKQGQVIGYVGASGLATAPHLHYEFLVNGVFRNPRTVSLPTADPVKPNERERFRTSISAPFTQLQKQSRFILTNGD